MKEIILNDIRQTKSFAWKEEEEENSFFSFFSTLKFIGQLTMLHPSLFSVHRQFGTVNIRA